MGAAAIALDEFLTTGTLRAGTSVANPIHFADVALASGFLATLGLVRGQSSARYLYLLGPVFALVAVVLSGTRGAVLAWLAMIGVAVGISVWLRLVSWRWLATIVVAAVCVGIVALLAGASHLSVVQRVIADLTSIAAHGLPTDSSTTDRLHMYEGALAAFLQSPLIGHGPFGYVEAAAANARVPFGGTPHLHSDLANFAASGGALGLLAYSLFLLAPLVEIWRGPVTSSRRGLVVVFASLAAGYFVMGLTNAVIGILTLTVFYAAIAAIAGSLSFHHAEAPA
jgi:O-antigen ligase